MKFEMFRVQFFFKCRKLRSRSANPSAKRKFSGAFSLVERTKLKEGQRINQEYIKVDVQNSFLSKMMKTLTA